jgi:hypothetical protein
MIQLITQSKNNREDIERKEKKERHGKKKEGG